MSHMADNTPSHSQAGTRTFFPLYALVAFFLLFLADFSFLFFSFLSFLWTAFTRNENNHSKHRSLDRMDNGLSIFFLSLFSFVMVVCIR